MDQLQELAPAEAYAGDVVLELNLYLKGRLSQDYDNAAGSIGDLLQDAGAVRQHDAVAVDDGPEHQGES